MARISSWTGAGFALVLMSACTGATVVQTPAERVSSFSGPEWSAAHRAMHHLGLTDEEVSAMTVIVIPERAGFRVGFVDTRPPGLNPSLHLQSNVEVLVDRTGHVHGIGRGE